MLRRLLIFLLILFLVSETIRGCGVLTHTEIVHRAVQKLLADGIACDPKEKCFQDESGMFDVRVLAQVYEKYQAAFQAGAPFPDSFYPGICFKGKYDDVSEDTHWGGFMNASINYIRRQPEPWDDATWRLVAFIYGLSSHQIADILWHNLGDKMRNGFLQVMANSDFHGVFQDAHPVGDAGADFIGSKLWDNSFIQLSKWEVPVEQLDEIYQEYYGDKRISRVAIETCSRILYLSRIAEYFLSDKLYTGVYHVSPFLSEQLNDYYKGGINDMVAWTIQYFQLVTDMINKGTQICDISDRREDIFDLQCNSTGTPFTEKAGRVDYRGLKPRPSTVHNQLGKDLFAELGDKEAYYENLRIAGKRFLILRLSAATRELIEKREEKTKKDEEKSQFEKKALEGTESSSIGCSNPFSNFGWAVTQISFNSSSKYLVVGAPDWSESNKTQSGKVFFVESSAVGKSFTFGSSESGEYGSLCPLSAPNADTAQFGSSIVALDMDGDGEDELLVGAPSSGGRTSTFLSYYGSIAMYSKLGNGWSASPTLWNGTLFDENLGFVMEGVHITDSENYVLTSSPYANDHRGVLQKVSLGGGKQLVIGGQQLGEWFGYSLSVEPGSDPRYAYVGAPNHRICASWDCSYNPSDVQGVGAVYEIDLESRDARMILQGTEQFMKTGWAVKSISRSLLAVSSPGVALSDKLNDYSGQVVIYERSQNGNFTQKTKLVGEKTLEHFGFSLHVDINNNLLLIGSPLWRNKIGFNFLKKQGAEFGKLYMYHLSTFQLVRAIEGSEPSSRFGTSSMVFTTTKNESMLVVSAPRHSLETSQSGIVTLQPID